MRSASAALRDELRTSAVFAWYGPRSGELVGDRARYRCHIEVARTSCGDPNLDRSAVAVEVDLAALCEASREANAARYCLEFRTLEPRSIDVDPSAHRRNRQVGCRAIECHVPTRALGSHPGGISHNLDTAVDRFRIHVGRISVHADVSADNVKIKTAGDTGNIDPCSCSLYPDLGAHWNHHFDFRWRRISFVGTLDEQLHAAVTSAHEELIPLPEHAAHRNRIAFPPGDLYTANKICNAHRARGIELKASIQFSLQVRI